MASLSKRRRPSHRATSSSTKTAAVSGRKISLSDPQGLLTIGLEQLDREVVHVDDANPVDGFGKLTGPAPEVAAQIADALRPDLVQHVEDRGEVLLPHGDSNVLEDFPVS